MDRQHPEDNQSGAEALLATHGRSFHWASRLLGRQIAGNAAQLYAFCRVLDDMADGDIDDGPQQLEIILATSATVDGQTTAHYIAERLKSMPVQISRLAHGVPVGGEVNYLDDGTLAQAMKARTRL